MISGPFVTLPNLVSMARVPLAAAAVACLAGGERLAAQLLLVASFASDAVDGMLARMTGTTSQWGRILDPLADKLVFAVVASALALLGLIPWWLVGVVVGRDLLVTVGGIVQMRSGRLPRPHPLGKASTVVLAVYLGKQAFWPAAALWADLDALGWLAVFALGVSTAAYAVDHARPRPSRRRRDRPRSRGTGLGARGAVTVGRAEAPDRRDGEESGQREQPKRMQ